MPRTVTGRLAGLGHTVLAGARDPQRGTKAAGELGAAFIHIDPTDDDSVEAAAALVCNEYGHLDVLINNAGTAAPRLGAEELTADAAMEGFAINVFGPIRVMRAFLPLLRAAEHPRIVNVSSGAGSFQRILEPGTVEDAVTLPVYPATKAALTLLTVQYAGGYAAIFVSDAASVVAAIRSRRTWAVVLRAMAGRYPRINVIAVAAPVTQ